MAISAVSSASLSLAAANSTGFSKRELEAEIKALKKKLAAEEQSKTDSEKVKTVKIQQLEQQILQIEAQIQKQSSNSK